jgi:hypothetical protein
MGSAGSEQSTEVGQSDMRMILHNDITQPKNEYAESLQTET